jgi:hypothetical protein
MDIRQIIEILCGVIAIYVGWRFIRVREIPVVSEGGTEPLGFLRGWEAVVAGLAVIALGLVLLAAAADLVKLP